MTRVGWILTTLPRSRSVLTCAETRAAARLQAASGGNFVTVVAQLAGDGVPKLLNESAASLRAKMISDQGTRLELANALSNAAGADGLLFRRYSQETGERNAESSHAFPRRTCSRATDEEGMVPRPSILYAPDSFQGPESTFSAKIFEVPIRLKVGGRAEISMDATGQGGRAQLSHSSFPEDRREGAEFLLKLLRQSDICIEDLSDFGLLMHVADVAGDATAIQIARCVTGRKNLPRNLRTNLLASALAVIDAAEGNVAGDSPCRRSI